MIESYTGQTVEVSLRAGRTTQGEAQWGAWVSMKARYQAQQRLVTDAIGGQVVAQGLLMFSGSQSLAVGDKVRTGGKVYQVIALRKIPGLYGNTVYQEADIG